MNQATALNLLKAGKNVFLTGSAGAGKTYVLNQYIQYLKERKIPVAVTASTGIAATHTKGMTIHAWSGIGVRSSLSRMELDLMLSKKYLKDNIIVAQVLIIDEISMLHREQIDMVNQVLKHFKGNNYPFGGVQVVFSGDFFQLPPVGGSSESNREKFAFMSAAWVEANLMVCYLTEQHRQSGGDLDNILNEIRTKSLSQKSLDLLEQSAQNTFEDHWEPPMLYTHNHDVNRTNNDFLNQLQGKPATFEAKTKGKKKLVDMLKNSVLAEENLYLKLGAKVMFVKNNYDQGYINGTLGTVVDYSPEKFPLVQLNSGRKLKVEPQEWSIEDEMGSPVASFVQFPLKLAWAITIHKSQGMTLDCAQVDLSRTFERGQGYVALSRLKSLEGLKLLGFNNTALQVDDLAFKADKRFQELSSEAAQQYAEDELKVFALSFIKKCGGISDPEEMKRYKKKKEEKIKVKKTPTHLVTKEYIDKNLSLQEIADERGLALSTIAGHLSKIHELYPDLNLGKYAPETAILNRIQTTYNDIVAENNPDKFSPDGSVSSKALFEAMNQEIDYPEIRLSMIFIKK